MRIWARITEHEVSVTTAAESPGAEWAEVDRCPRIGEETVAVVDGKAQIIPEPERSAPDPRRAAIAAALPDILLAVADGAELRAEVRKVIEQLEAQHGSER